ncbi:MAG: acyl-CoA dehydrogenase family protein [Hyphomonadaceae bacterium]
MIDFELTEADREILALAKEEALIGRAYARHYDTDWDAHEPPADPPLKSPKGPRQLVEERLAETSGRNVLDGLLSIIDQWGDVAVRHNEIGIGTMIVMSGGTPDIQAEWGDKLLSVSMTEPGAGSDPSRIQMVVQKDPATKEWILNGEKIYISAGGASAGAVVLAKVVEENGKTALGTFLVPKGTPGFNVLPQVRKLGIRAWDTADFYFENCRIPEHYRLHADFKKTMMAFNNTRPLMAAKGLGCARAALDFTREQLTERGFDLNEDAPLSRRSAFADRLAKMEAHYDASLLTLMRCKWIEDREGGSKIEASMTKAKGALAARKITQECIALLGAAGIDEAHLIEKWFRDARIFDLFEGPGEIQRLIIARYLLGYGPTELS